MMITQILAIAAFYTIVYLSLRLLRFIQAYGQEKRECYRSYLIGLDETDLDSDQNGDSSDMSLSQGARSLYPVMDSDLVDWPTELDLRVDSPAYALTQAPETSQK